MAFDGSPARAVSVADWAASVTVRAPEPTTIAWVGLGAMVSATGVHKPLDPPSWSAYVVPQLAPVLVVSPVTFMLANDVLKVDFGATITADHYTAPASAVTAVPLPTTCFYLTAVFVVEGGLFGDVLARDIGLARLAWIMPVDSFRRPT